MAENITLTASIRSNLLSLQTTNSLLNRTSERLATGLRVNSALDDPGAYFTARSLNNRANDLSKLKDSIGQSIQTIKATDTALKSITALVEQAQSIASQAVEAAANAGNTVSEIVGVAGSYTGTTSTTTLTTAFGVTTAKTITFQVTNGASVTLTAGSTVGDLASKLTAIDSNITATFDYTTRKLTIKGTNGVEIKATNGTASNALTSVFGTALVNATAKTFGSSGGADTITLATDYNKVRAQINLLIADAGYKGVNLLNGVDMKVTFDEDGQSVLTVAGTALETKLNISTAVWATGGNITTDVDKIKLALTELRKVSSQYGTDLGIIQTREDFTNTFITGLQEGAGRLINANLEEESANLLALQTRQALGTTSLSFANQSQQSILQLFR